MTNYKIENECIGCEKMATSEILDLYMVEMLEVCDDCYKNCFSEVANEGKEYFFEWATEMYGDEGKANHLCELIYGSGVGEDMKSGKVEYMTMFTYGILKYPHNIQREGGIDIIENCTVSGHKMHLYNASFPITRKTDSENDLVYGTLFKVPTRQVLHSYDFTEGYSPNRPYSQNMYNREEVEIVTPDGEVVKAQMYYANPRQFAGKYTNFTLIPSGNFDDKHMAQSYHAYSNLRTKKGKGKKK